MKVNYYYERLSETHLLNHDKARLFCIGLDNERSVTIPAQRLL